MLERVKEEYKKLENIFCPYLNQQVVFNSKGFRHLLYKNGRRKRSETEVLERSKSFKLLYKILGVTTTVQEIDYFENTEMCAFVAIVEDVKLKIIIKKDGTNGSWYFYSLIPNYISSPKRDFKIKKPTLSQSL